MEAYFTIDKDPRGGIYDVFRTMPDMTTMRNTVQEVRRGDLPAEIFAQILLGEIKPHPTTMYDEHFAPYWEQATVVWTRGGNVNGSE